MRETADQGFELSSYNKNAITFGKPSKKGHVALCIDISGSMENKAKYVKKAYKLFGESLRDHSIDYSFTEIRFSTRSQIVKSKTSLDQMYIDDFVTIDSTALYDAIMDSIKALGPIPLEEKAIVAVITDGLENASDTDLNTVVSTIEALKKLSNWTFIYIGLTNQDNQAHTLGFSSGNIAYMDSGDLAETLKRLADNIERFCIDGSTKDQMLLLEG